MPSLLQRISTTWMTFLLWLTTVVVGLVEVMMLRDLLVAGYTWWRNRSLSADGFGMQEYGTSYWNANLIGTWSVLILTLLFICFVVATGEYHYHRRGTRDSARLLIWTFAIQAVILIVAYLL